MPSHTIAEVLKNVLGDMPEAAFFTAIQGRGGSPNQQRFNRTQAGPTSQDFQAKLGQQALAGTIPNLNFNDFLQQFLLSGELERKFNEQPRAFTGRSENFFNPRTRFQFGF